MAPDGSPDPSIFSTGGDPVGIQVGTAVTTLVRKAEHAPAAGVGFRHLWGRRKREELTRTAETEPGGLYDRVEPVLPLGLPFAPTAVSKEWFDWPALRLDRSIAERYADSVPTNPHAVALGMVGSLARQGSQCKKMLLWATRATCAVSSTKGES